MRRIKLLRPRHSSEFENTRILRILTQDHYYSNNRFPNNLKYVCDNINNTYVYVYLRTRILVIAEISMITSRMHLVNKSNVVICVRCTKHDLYIYIYIYICSLMYVILNKFILVVSITINSGHIKHKTYYIKKKKELYLCLNSK
jgi:hypothetical protein